MFEKRDNVGLYIGAKYNKDLSEEIATVLIMDTKEIINKITSSNKGIQILMDYFFFLNLYLSDDIYGMSSKFYDEDNNICLGKIYNLKKAAQASMLSTDNFQLNITKLKNYDKHQILLITNLLLCISDYEKFGESALDGGNFRIADILLSKGYMPDEYIEDDEMLGLAEVLSYHTSLYAIDFLNYLNK